MGSICQKQDGWINWPCKNEIRTNSRRPTFTVIPEEDSVVMSQCDKSQFTASQFYMNLESQRQATGKPIQSKQAIQLFNPHTGKYLSSHSIKVQGLHIQAYEVSLQSGELDQYQCYNEWTICCDNFKIQTGDIVAIKHCLSERYLQAQAVNNNIVVFCDNNPGKVWKLEFDGELLVDGSFVEITHIFYQLQLSPLNKRAILNQNRQVNLNNHEGKGTLWKVQSLDG